MKLAYLKDEMKKMKNQNPQVPTSKAHSKNEESIRPRKNQRSNRTLQNDFFCSHDEEPILPKCVFYHIEFEADERIEVNPFRVRDQIEMKIGRKIKNFHPDSRNGFSVEVATKAEGEKLITLKSIDNLRCKVEYHKYMNQSKGLIYIQAFDFTKEFVNDLKSEYPEIEEAIEAKFIRSRYENTTPVLLTFNLLEPPYSLYIPGERSDNIVYPYRDRPMMCNNCQRYGHTKSRCNRDTVCRKCGIPNPDHSVEECNDPLCCPNCEEDHQAGSRECGIEQGERRIKEVQEKEKVGRRRAIQILRGDDESSFNGNSFPTHFSCKMDPAKKRSFTPWALEKCITHELASKPSSIRSKGDTEFIIQVDNEKDSITLPRIKKLNNVEVQIEECKDINQSKGLIYLYGDKHQIHNEAYQKDLKKEFKLVDVELARWIKPRNPNVKAVLITFRENIPPKYLDILGEQAKTKVNEYFEKPMSCQNCLRYGHTTKRCKETRPTCARCSKTGHSANRCNASEKCIHCGDNHLAFSRTCQIQKEEQDIVVVRTRERVSRSQAIQILRKQTPARGMNYAATTKGVSPEHSTQQIAQIDPQPPASPSSNESQEKSNKQTQQQTNQRDSQPSTSRQSNIPVKVTGYLTKDFKEKLSQNAETSENNSEIRDEAQMFFDAFEKNCNKTSSQGAPQQKNNKDQSQGKKGKRVRSPSLEKNAPPNSKKLASQQGPKPSQGSPKGNKTPRGKKKK